MSLSNNIKTYSQIEITITKNNNNNNKATKLNTKKNNELIMRILRACLILFKIVFLFRFGCYQQLFISYKWL